MGVENERIRNLSHLSLESIPKSINNENSSVVYDASIENHHQQSQTNGLIGDIKEVNERNCGEYEAELHK